MNRKEHLKWCKKRALEYVDANDLDNAWTSMIIDLGKHEELKNHTGIDLGMKMLIGGQLSTPKTMREYIEGFN